MRKFLSVSVVSGVLCLAALAASFISVDALMKDGKKHDKKDVTVRGRVDRFEAKTSKAGNKYTTFQLLGEKGKVNVYMRDHLKVPLKKGDLVEVMGVFRLEKKVGDRVFKNEIEITAKEGKKYGAKKIG